MTQPSLPLPAKPSYTALAVELFESHPLEPFDAVHLMRVLGICGWRSRISNARAILEAMTGEKWTIANEQIRRKNGPTTSLYRYVPVKEKKAEAASC